MNILSRMKYRALSRNSGWPMNATPTRVESETAALLLRDTAVAAEPRTIDSGQGSPRAWPDNCIGIARDAVARGNVKVLSKEKCQVVAERNGWSLDRARGYVDGEICRLRSKKPSKYALVGIDEYSLGFRAAYYERHNEAPSTEHSRTTGPA
jgi:hypothetical protein